MNHYFIASLCRNGILGGGIILNSEKMIYKTGKVTVPEKFRNLEIRYKDIAAISKGRFMILPTVTLKLKDSEEYKFVVFARKKFLNVLKEKGVEG